METMITASENLDYIDPAVGVPLAIILWAVVLIQWRRDIVKRRKAERLEREAVLAEYHASLKRQGWVD